MYLRNIIFRNFFLWSLVSLILFLFFARFGYKHIHVQLFISYRTPFSSSFIERRWWNRNRTGMALKKKRKRRSCMKEFYFFFVKVKECDGYLKERTRKVGKKKKENEQKKKSFIPSTTTSSKYHHHHPLLFFQTTHTHIDNVHIRMYRGDTPFFFFSFSPPTFIHPSNQPTTQPPTYSTSSRSR